MKKIILFLFCFLSVVFTSCDKEDRDPTNDPGDPTNILLDKFGKTKVAQVDYPNMTRDVNWSLKHAIIKFEDGRRVCIPFVNYNFTLVSGDVVNSYSVYRTSKEEAFEIVTAKGTISLQAQVEDLFNTGYAKSAETRLGGQRSVEGLVDEVFDMYLRHSWTLNPLATVLPIRTTFVRVKGELFYLPFSTGLVVDPKVRIGEKVRINTAFVCRNKISSVERI